VRIPLATKEEVAVIVPPVIDPERRLLIVPVRACSVVAKKLVEVALVNTVFEAERLVKEAVNPFRSVAKKLVEVEFVVEALVAAKLLVIVAFVAVKLVKVPVAE
jgi:hypothetical protein